MSVIETALSAGERVSSLLGMSWGGRKRLPEADARLLHAYSLYKAGLCPSCGGPLEECTDPEREWDVDDSRTCYRTVALRGWERRQDEGAQRDGVLPAVVPAGRGSTGLSQATLVAALTDQAGG